MNEKESFATINVEGEQYEVGQHNATLYKHLGQTALDHVFVSIGESAGIYVWENNAGYEDLAKAVVENECMLVLNISEPSDMDVKAYIKHNKADLNIIPEWLPEV